MIPPLFLNILYHRGITVLETFLFFSQIFWSSLTHEWMTLFRDESLSFCNDHVNILHYRDISMFLKITIYPSWSNQISNWIIFKRSSNSYSNEGSVLMVHSCLCLTCCFSAFFIFCHSTSDISSLYLKFVSLLNTVFDIFRRQNDFQIHLKYCGSHLASYFSQ